MKFNKIILFTLIIFVLVSISAVSAESDTNVISEDSSADTQDVAITSTADDSQVLGNESSGESNSSIISSDLTKYYRNASKYEATFLDNDGNLLNNTDVYLYINGQNYTRTTDDNGVVHFSINLGPNVYNLTATNPVTGESVVNTVTVLTTISGNNVTKYYKNDTQYYVNVLDGTGAPVTGKVVFNINGVMYTRNVTDGVGRLNINLSPGKYTITAENLLNGEKISNMIEVKSTISGKDITKYYRNGTQYYVNLTDGQGNPLNGTEAEFNINGVIYKRSIVNGTARLNINLSPAKYTLTVTNPVNGEQATNTVTVLSKVTLQNSQSGGNVSIEYNTKAQYKVLIHNDNGSLAVNQTVNFNVNGRVYQRLSDDKGIAALTINLGTGDYVITADFEGCMISNLLKVRITPDIKLGPTTVKKGEIFYFTLTQHSTGQPVTGKHLGVIYFNNTGWGAYPDDEGVVRFTLNVPVDNYMAYIGMTDDGTYSSKWIVNTIKVTN